MATDPQMPTRNIVMRGSYSLPQTTGVIHVTACIETLLSTDEVVGRVQTAGYDSVSVRGEDVVVNIGHIRGVVIDSVLPTLYRLAAD